MERYSNDDILNEMEILVSYILNSDLYHDYLSLKEKIGKNETLLAQMNVLKKMQQRYVRSNFSDLVLKEQIEKEKQTLEQIPLYHVYLQKVAELDQVCSLIREGLNQSFSDILEGK